jgi:hypothetical protein
MPRAKSRVHAIVHADLGDPVQSNMQSNACEISLSKFRDVKNVTLNVSDVMQTVQM